MIQVGSAALFDFNGDGLLDIYLLRNGGPQGTANRHPEHQFHDLRHTVASLLLSKGCSLRAVARLGHAVRLLTLRVCAHCRMITPSL